LDQRVRRVGVQVANGILGDEEARAINAPLLAKCAGLKLRLASLPERRPVPSAEQIDPVKFRAAVLESWSARPLDECRRSLDRLLQTITLDEGGAHVQYAVKGERRFRHQAPGGLPPEGQA
jgi:hypothetical protein